MRWRFKCGKVVGHIIKSGKNGAIVQTKKFKAWCSLLPLREMLNGKWRYIVLVSKENGGDEKSEPVGTFYLSRDGRFFYLKSRQHETVCIGWTDNLVKMLQGQTKRAPIHQRLRRRDGVEA
jgi:hypothetical protein